jgi:hypothetical protein
VGRGPDFTHSFGDIPIGDILAFRDATGYEHLVFKCSSLHLHRIQKLACKEFLVSALDFQFNDFRS